MVKEFEKDFRDPSSKYRSCPFWAWNTRLEENELLRQIDAFKKMGFGGFFMHSRIGLDTEYLGDEFFAAIRACIRRAKEREMFAELYDEDLWPSGIAGGLVTADSMKYRKKALIFTKNDYSDDENYLLFARFSMNFDECGRAVSYAPLESDTSENGESWNAYIYTVPDRAPHQTPPRGDVLDREGVAKFIELTHKKYAREIGYEFGKSVRTIFTDEPTSESVFYKKLYMPVGGDEVSCPYTRGLDGILLERYGFDLKACLPEIFFDFGEGKNKVRYYFRRLLSELFYENYFCQIYDWCEENGIDFTGHILFEESLALQGRASGDPMLLYSKLHIPGMDLLFDAVEYNTAKQVQSVVRQRGKKGMMSELYGVTGWDFDFRGYKFQGDWQAALGVTLRVPHLAWLSMEGVAKRDYPASIGVQSPWWEEYYILEDHFARVNAAMTRGEAVVNIGVIHPIESYLTVMGDDISTASLRAELDEKFSLIAKLLLEDHLDFDYISESLLERDVEASKKSVRIGKMRYNTIVVPYLLCLRKTTVDFLSAFAQKGGRVIFTSECPVCIDGGDVDDRKLKLLYENCPRSSLDGSLIAALEDEREVRIENDTGRKMIFQLRREGDEKWLFAAFSEKCRSDESLCSKTAVKIKGEYQPTLCDTLTGELKPIDYVIKNGFTEVRKDLFNSDSLLLRLTPAKVKRGYSNEKAHEGGAPKKLVCERVSCDEPNVLLLDYAEYSFDGKEYFPKKNILKIDREYSNKLGIPPRSNYDRAQPWRSRQLGDVCDGKYLYLRFRIQSEIEYECAYLALEGLDRTEVRFNGEFVEMTDCGFYVDKSIRKIALPRIEKGENLLEMKIKIVYSNIKGAEYCYLLGDFGVAVEGSEAKIVEQTQTADFVCTNELKMPFFGGNITYECRETVDEDSNLIVKIPEYRGALTRVYLDGDDKGYICFAPYTLDLGLVKKGEHTVSFKLYGNRYNTFGSLHCKKVKIGELPAMWQPDPPAETHEYLLKELGILKPPTIIYKNVERK